MFSCVVIPRDAVVFEKSEEGWRFFSNRFWYLAAVWSCKSGLKAFERSGRPLAHGAVQRSLYSWLCGLPRWLVDNNGGKNGRALAGNLDPDARKVDLHDQPSDDETESQAAFQN
jgi:hypothetical protein